MHQRVIAIVFEYGSLFILSTNLHFPNFKEFIENSFKIKTHTDNKYIQSLDEKEMGLPSLEGGMLVRIGKESPKWRWLKDLEGESPRK